MTNFIIEKFIRNHANTTNSIVRENYGKVAGVVGIICNAFLSITKILAGLIFSSVSILADGVNNLADAGNSVITLIGFKLSGRPADKNHPYGHARYEYISGLLVSIVIIVLGIQLAITSFNKILNPDPLNFSYISVAVLVISIAVKLWMAFFNRKIGKIIGSVAISATSQDSINDVYTTSGVLIGLIIGKITNWQLDGYIGMFVALFIIYSGYSLVRDTLSPLLGEAPDYEMVKMIEDKIHTYDGVMGIHDLVVHNYGPGKCFASVHVEVPAKQDILKSHDIIDNIEHDFMKSYNLHLVIHLDPIETDNPVINNLRQTVEKILESIHENLTMHDFRAALGHTHNNLIFDVVIPYDCKLTDKELRYLITQKVHEDDPNNFVVVEFDRNYIM